MLRKVSSRLFLFSDPSLRASERYGPISDAIVHYWTLPSRGGGKEGAVLGGEGIILTDQHVPQRYCRFSILYLTARPCQCAANNANPRSAFD